MEDYIDVVKTFGCDVFNDAVMQERLPKKVYIQLKETIKEGKELSLEIADVVPLARQLFEWLQAQTFAKLVNLPNGETEAGE